MRKITILVSLAGISVNCNFGKNMKTGLSTGSACPHDGFKAKNIKIFNNYPQLIHK
jgi:hypothetical protein